MRCDIEKLSEILNLSPYQRQCLQTNEYNLGRLQKRGGVLYAPYRASGFWRGISRIVRGAPADLIGKNKMLLRGQRGIQFSAGGYHRVRIGRFVYYADPDGQAVSRDIYIRATGRER